MTSVLEVFYYLHTQKHFSSADIQWNIQNLLHIDKSNIPIWNYIRHLKIK